MGHDKLRKFAENETFSCLLQPSAQELLADGYTVHACVDAKTRKPIRVPEYLLSFAAGQTK